MFDALQRNKIRAGTFLRSIKFNNCRRQINVYYISYQFAFNFVLRRYFYFNQEWFQFFLRNQLKFSLSVTRLPWLFSRKISPTQSIDKKKLLWNHTYSNLLAIINHLFDIQLMCRYKRKDYDVMFRSKLFVLGYKRHQSKPLLR